MMCIFPYVKVRMSNEVFNEFLQECRVDLRRLNKMKTNTAGNYFVVLKLQD